MPTTYDGSTALVPVVSLDGDCVGKVGDVRPGSADHPALPPQPTGGGYNPTALLRNVGKLERSRNLDQDQTHHCSTAQQIRGRELHGSVGRGRADRRYGQIGWRQTQSIVVD